VDPLEICVPSRVVEARAASDPDRVAFVVDHGKLGADTITFGALARAGNQLAHVEREAGLGSGDRVAVMLKNVPEFVHAYVGHSKVGIETVPVDPRARGEKLRYFLDFAECKGLITADEVVADDAVAAEIRDAGVRTWVVSTPEGRAKGLDPSKEWAVLNEALDGPDRPDVGQHVDDLTRPWLLAYTSGTTGNPKAILFLYNRMMMYQHVIRYFGYQEDDIPYTGLSLTHGNAIIASLMPALWGLVDHTVFSPWFTKSRIWDVCIAHGATTWSNLGGIATAVYSEPPAEKDRQHKVRLVISAGMPRELWEPFEERFGVRILEWYGTMEGGFAYKPIGVGPVGSFGKPPEDLLEWDVVDDNGEPVPANEPGELLIRPKGGTAALEYYKNAEASAKKTAGGWLHTGDTVTRDEDGFLFFLHRKEEGGLRKLGEFISEGFIFRVVAEFPEVLDVHIYGIPSKAGAPGETDIVAAVVVADRQRFDVGALLDHCRARLERSHVPDLIQLVDELPKTASEKVQRRFLVEDLEAPGAQVYESRAVTSSG
jgi:crotonobetaine/carnitine-CoA ligase